MHRTQDPSTKLVLCAGVFISFNTDFSGMSSSDVASFLARRPAVQPQTTYQDYYIFSLS